MSVINVRSNTPFAGFYVVFRGSVANENSSNFGISHLMEHLLCHNHDDLLSDFTRDGINYNAGTYEDAIVFYCTGLEKYLAPYRSTFLKRLLSFNTTKEVLDNEVQIVLQEYANYFAKQASSHYYNLLRKNYGYFAAIGSKDALKNLTVDDCAEYFEKQYRRPNMIINFSPDVDFQTDIEFNYNYPLVTLKNTQEKIDLELTNQFKQTSSVRATKLIDKDFREIDIITDMLGNGLESPLYKTIREERGLVYYVSCNGHNLSPKQGMLYISSEMEDKNVVKFKEAVEEVLSQELNEERFEVIRQSKRVNIEKQNILNHTNKNRFIWPESYIDLEFIENLEFDKIKEIYKDQFKDFVYSVDKEEFSLN